VQRSRVGKKDDGGPPAAQSFPLDHMGNSDLVEVAQSLVNEKAGGLANLGVSPMNLGARIKIQKASDCHSAFYIRIITEDQTGVLAKISGILGKHKIGIAHMVQRETLRGGRAAVIFFTYSASLHHLKQSMRDIHRLGVVKERAFYMAIETLETKNPQ